MRWQISPPARQDKAAVTARARHFWILAAGRNGIKGINNDKQEYVADWRRYRRAFRVVRGWSIRPGCGADRSRGGAERGRSPGDRGNRAEAVRKSSGCSDQIGRAHV